MVSQLPRRLCRVGMMMSLCLRSSLAVWSALVEMIRLLWLSKLAAMTFRCLEVLLAVRAVLIFGLRGSRGLVCCLGGYREGGIEQLVLRGGEKN